MTKDDIIRMAKEAGFSVGNSCTVGDIDSCERFAALVAAAEREACAGLRKEMVLRGTWQTEYEEGFWDAVEHYEDAIRARSQS
jgi:hypothetical protein